MPQHFKYIPHPRYLYYCGKLSSFGGIRHIIELGLPERCENLYNEGATSLASQFYHLPKLRSLTVRSARIHDNDIRILMQSLADLKRLKALDVCGNENSPEVFNELRTAMESRGIPFCDYPDPDDNKYNPHGRFHVPSYGPMQPRCYDRHAEKEEEEERRQRR